MAAHGRVPWQRTVARSRSRHIDVILSEAKDPIARAVILRFAQDDK
jgi:hypothetical protein